MSPKHLLPFLFTVILSCGTGDYTSYDPSFEVKSFSPYFKSCSGLTCYTYMKNVIWVTNNLDHPTNITLSCDYYMDGVFHSNITNNLKMEEKQRKEVVNYVTFNTEVNEAAFYGVFCKLVAQE